MFAYACGRSEDLIPVAFQTREGECDGVFRFFI